MTMMTWWLLSVLLVCHTATISSANTDRYSISCSSEYTPRVGSFCVGTPLQCTVQLDSNNCNSSFQDPVLLSTSDISLQVAGTSAEGPIAPDFILSQLDFLLTVTINYYPASTDSTLRVQISSANTDCDFDVDSNNLPVFSPTECSNPIQFDVTIVDPPYPGEVEGGDIVSLDLDITANSRTIQSLIIVVGNFHPGLLLLSNISFMATDGEARNQSYGADVHALSAGNFEPLLFISQLPLSETLSISLSFQVLPFVQPKAALFFSFYGFYYVSSFGNFTFKTSTPQFREFVVSSPYGGNFTLSLPYYNDSDHVEDVIPPNEGDIYEIQVPFYFPCVMTSLNIELSIPEFLADNYTFFFTNVTGVSMVSPSNLFSTPSLCDYRVLSSFDRDACLNSLSNSNTPQPAITFEEKTGTGKDTVFINFGTVWRNITVGDDCTGNEASPNCGCDREMAEITVTGIVLTELPCNNQTLADNVTINLTYISDVNMWTNSDIDETPQIMWNNSINTTLFAVNASSPAISLPISSHVGDAGDAFNITFGVLHNAEYSSFTAYDLNYTFSIDQHLDPEPNIIICLFNTSSEPFFCEEVPFINYTIIRYGYHEV